MRHTTNIPHVNTDESYSLNTSNSDNVIGMSNFTHSKVQNDSLFNTLVTLKLIYAESIVIINDKERYQNHMSE